MKYFLLVCVCFITFQFHAQEFNLQQEDTIKNLAPVIITLKIQSPGESTTFYISIGAKI
jgi:hypothetical protein